MSHVTSMTMNAMMQNMHTCNFENGDAGSNVSNQVVTRKVLGNSTNEETPSQSFEDNTHEDALAAE